MPLLIFVSPSLMPPHPLFLSNTFRPMILDEQSQKQNELEQPRWEQMARNCLVEEARESIFTRPGGVAVARRGGKKCRCICFDQIWPRGSIWKIFITHTLGSGIQQKCWGWDRGCNGELSSGQGGRCVAESTAADASQINTTLKCCKNCKTFTWQQSVLTFANLILGFCGEVAL